MLRQTQHAPVYAQVQGMGEPTQTLNGNSVTLFPGEPLRLTVLKGLQPSTNRHLRTRDHGIPGTESVYAPQED